MSPRDTSANAAGASASTAGQVVTSVTMAPRDDVRLTGRYRSLAGAVACSQLVEYFDFYTIGFVVSMISGPWHLTFGEDAAILLATGVGTIFGSLLWGWMGDRWGRRPMLIASIVTFSLATALSALTPTGWWWLLALFRLVVGAGTGATNTTGPPILLEYTPTKHRAIYAGIFSVALVPVGGVITSTVVGSAGDSLGFRGVLLLGLIPLLVLFWIAKAVPESPRWLARKGRVDEARTAIERVFGPGTAQTGSVSVPVRAPGARSHYLGMIRHHRPFWSTVLLWLLIDTVFAGIGLWGPTLISQVQNISTESAANMFIIVTLGGFVGRMLCPLLARRYGRRTAGAVAGFGGGILLALSGVLHSYTLGGASLFFLLLVIGYVFADGGFTNLVPFTGEVWPSELRVHGQGLGNAMGGVGKILGPLALALFANSSNFVDPEATAKAIRPVFLFFGVVIFLCAVVFLTIAPETNRRSLENVSGSASPGPGGTPGHPGSPHPPANGAPTAWPGGPAKQAKQR